MNLIDGIYNKYKNKRQKIQLLFDKELEKYKGMAENEFIKEYIDVKAKYEHKKFMLTVITITIIITIVMETWRYLYNILIQLLSLSINDNYINIDSAKVLVIAIIILFLFVAFLIIFTLTSNLYKLSKHKLFLEEVKTIRKG